MTHEQAPLDLVEGDRLLAAFKRSQPKYGMAKAGTFQDWLLDNGEALVAALKAANERAEDYHSEWESAVEREVARWHAEKELRADLANVNTDRDLAYSELVERGITIDSLRADLARVVADAKKWQEEAEQIHREDTELESRYEAAQARIADLEGSLRWLLVEAEDMWGVPSDDHPKWSASAMKRARANLAEAQTPSAS